ncbi:MAG: VOC family protein [Planctomycetota bacterium]
MKITAFAPVIPVSDVDAAIRFFTQKLGFRQEFRFGDYAGVERDECLLHLSLVGNPNTGALGSASVYLFCDDVDAIYEDLVQRKVVVLSEPKDYAYGMRDFVVADADGNRFTFGMPNPT